LFDVSEELLLIMMIMETITAPVSVLIINRYPAARRPTSAHPSIAPLVEILKQKNMREH